ncbi:hypothetical protein G7085_06455 [Tessaracoccus sp. HDW20]|uniref:hypothetical protein n=1 Tax=Tessaracoccus coleopterorum TaxID=2714950 RepID=UPI0018D40FD4|nr:hypothetical protein [Tessaracoccus coleopterorum]NHB84369.1 hypothetical protein [Tessaracoccus coleopterorum]
MFGSASQAWENAPSPMARRNVSTWPRAEHLDEHRRHDRRGEDDGEEDDHLVEDREPHPRCQHDGEAEAERELDGDQQEEVADVADRHPEPGVLDRSDIVAEPDEVPPGADAVGVEHAQVAGVTDAEVHEATGQEDGRHQEEVVAGW